MNREILELVLTR